VVCILGVLFATSNVIFAQQENFLALIPAFHDRLNTSGGESPLRLQNQQFILFVYRNAVTVYSEANFVNTGTDTLTQELARPSTGHVENGDESGGRISNGILSVQLWVEGEKVAPEFIQDGSEEWYTIRARFAPGTQRKVKAVFWAQTSLTDIDSLPGLDTVAITMGKRGFMVDIAHAAVWNGVFESIDVTVVLKGGMSFQRDSFTAEPGTYDLQDSTITWSLRDIEPSVSDNITVSYTPSGNWTSATNTMAKLSAYIVKKVYDNLLYYVEQKEQD
jgi:hypothetical protein